MRDNYRREYKKLVILKAQDKSVESSWVHYKNLEFLEKIHKRKQVLILNDSSKIKNFNNDDIEICHDDDDNNNFDNYSYVKQQQQKVWLMNNNILTNCCPHDPGDEIVNFFKSIAPYLSMMDPTKKLRVRIEIQEIILNELSRKIDAAREKMISETNLSGKRSSKRIVKRNRKYL